MFLIVFTTLILSILSLFAQIVALQTAQLYHSQNGLMQSMITWHGMVVTKVTANATLHDWATYGLNGCSMTASTPALNGPYGICTTPAPLKTGDGFWVAGFNNIFYSVAYQDPSTSNDYVVTFAYANPADATGGIWIPDASATSTSTGYTIRDLSAQFMRAAPTNLTFGTVQSAGVLAIPAVARQGAASYPIPAWIPLGAIAIISPGT